MGSRAFACLDLAKRFVLLVPLVLVAGCPSEPNPSGPAARSQAPAASAQPGNAATQPAAPGTASKTAAQAAPSGPPISGQVTLDSSLPNDAVKETDVLFIMAREKSEGDVPGRLIAAVRQAPVRLPFAFEIGQKDVMVPGSAFHGPFLLNARLDRDGDPMTKGPDDLYATYEGEVKSGQKDVQLVLKKQALPKP